MKKDYTITVNLKHNESAAKINKETGEIKELSNGVNNIPEGKEIFEPKALFKKDYTKSWQYLCDKLSAIEFKAAMKLALKAKANTNSLEPLGEDTTYQDLSLYLGVSINVVNRVVDKLFKIGVYGKFEVYDKTKPYTRFWILNPYLSFDGRIIHSDIAELFKGTEIALHFHSKDNIN